MFVKLWQLGALEKLRDAALDGNFCGKGGAGADRLGRTPVHFPREEHLADLQNDLHLWRWMDGSPICGLSYLLHTFGVVFDHKKLLHSEDAEWFCNDPKLCVVIPISDTLQNLKYVQGFVVQSWGLLSDPITLSDGTQLRVSIRFLKGDAPIQQKASGCNTGNATYRCWLCDASVQQFTELSRCSECEPRDLTGLAASAEQAMSAPGCEGHVNPRALRVKQLRGLLKKLGKKTRGLQGVLLTRAIHALKGVNSYPMLLLSDLGSKLDVLDNVECAADIALHVLKGTLYEYYTNAHRNIVYTNILIY